MTETKILTDWRPYILKIDSFLKTFKKRFLSTLRNKPKYYENNLLIPYNLRKQDVDKLEDWEVLAALYHYNCSYGNYDIWKEFGYKKGYADGYIFSSKVIRKIENYGTKIYDSSIMDYNDDNKETIENPGVRFLDEKCAIFNIWKRVQYTKLFKEMKKKIKRIENAFYHIKREYTYGYNNDKWKKLARRELKKKLKSYFGDN
jgi:hypothetical protein